MASRTETAQATRGALVRAASELLDEGGPEAVTLRAVGARAGVSRGAPYGHFADKEHLLTSLATTAWNGLADELDELQADPRRDAAERLEQALLALVGIARAQPHLYRLMFSTPSADPEAAVRAAGRSQDRFLEIVADVVGAAGARRFGALLLASAHGIAGLELSGHLAAAKWQVGGDELVGMLVEAVRSSGP